ncbi:cyclic nucleotide-binding domain-containing protein [Candidatus Gracilibacteria bacterium]|nr:cyclic nucleotide-binding domain-containing protein [Candidatus Gracilibacteria bacterium]
MKYSLSHISLFAGLSPEERKNIEDFCQEKILGEGEYLFREGDEPQAIYIVTSGSFSIYKGEDKKELAIVERGELLGEMAFFGEEKERNASIVAREDSEVLVLLAFSIAQLFGKYPELHEKLQDIIHARQEENKNKGF